MRGEEQKIEIKRVRVSFLFFFATAIFIPAPETDPTVESLFVSEDERKGIVFKY